MSSVSIRDFVFVGPGREKALDAEDYEAKVRFVCEVF